MKYTKSRDLVWKILINNKISSLPIDLEKICKTEKINLFTFEDGKDFIKSLDLEEHMLENDAFSINSVIFYNSDKPRQRARFSIAHELGHIFLHTTSASRATLYNREPSPNDDPVETEANIFASRLLAPLCILQFLNVNSPEEISQLCDISYSAAKIRFQRLCEIRKRSSIRLKEKKHGTFLLSKLERQLIENFDEFIKQNKKPWSKNSSDQ